MKEMQRIQVIKVKYFMDKVALDTGSSDGFGKEVAKRLVIQGVHAVLHGRNRIKTEWAKDEISVDTTGLMR